MAINPKIDEHLYRVFTQNFTARDIAEALVSFDETASAEEVKRFMQERHFRIVGIRRGGLVVGYVDQQRLGDGLCRDHLVEIVESETIDSWTSFAEVVVALRDSERLFVRSLGQIAGIISRSDLQKPPIRMWLFGMITIIEMAFQRLIQQRFAGDQWQSLLSQPRLEKAHALLESRRDRNQELDLLDCLQFCDKGQLLVKDAELRKELGYSSKKDGQRRLRKLEALRDNLAHSQDILGDDWDTIVMLSENLDLVLTRTADVSRPSVDETASQETRANETPAKER